MRFLCRLLIMLSIVGCGRIQNPDFTGGTSTVPEGMVVEVTITNADALQVNTPTEAVILLIQDGSPVRGATLEIEGNMTHAGMEPLFARAAETKPGEYRAPLEWTMGGDWLLIVRGVLPDGTVIEHRVEGITVES